MKLARTLRVFGLLSAAAVCSAFVFFILWRHYSLYAVVASGFLLFGGAALLPVKGPYVHAVSLGLCVGAFIGSALGAAQIFGQTQQSTQRSGAVQRQALLPRSSHSPGVIEPVVTRPRKLRHQARPPNPSVKGTPASGLRPLAVAPYVER